MLRQPGSGRRPGVVRPPLRRPEPPLPGPPLPIVPSLPSSGRIGVHTLIVTKLARSWYRPVSDLLDPVGTSVAPPSHLRPGDCDRAGHDRSAAETGGGGHRLPQPGTSKPWSACRKNRFMLMGPDSGGGAQSILFLVEGAARLYRSTSPGPPRRRSCRGRPYAMAGDQVDRRRLTPTAGELLRLRHSPSPRAGTEDHRPARRWPALRGKAPQAARGSGGAGILVWEHCPGPAPDGRWW